MKKKGRKRSRNQSSGSSLPYTVFSPCRSRQRGVSSPRHVPVSAQEYERLSFFLSLSSGLILSSLMRHRYRESVGRRLHRKRVTKFRWKTSKPDATRTTRRIDQHGVRRTRVLTLSQKHPRRKSTSTAARRYSISHDLQNCDRT